MSHGARFADPCEEDLYLDHLQETADGRLEELTPCGEYSNAHIRLSRPELQKWRRLRNQAKKDIPLFTATQDRLRRLLLEYRGQTEQEQIQAELDALGRRIEETRRRFSLR